MSDQRVSPAHKLAARALLAEHGKTFYWASLFLSKDRAELAALLYACCRQLDDIADDPALDPLQKTALLGEIRSAIFDNGAIAASQLCATGQQLALAWRHLIQRGVDGRAVSSLIDGLLRDNLTVCFEEQAELERYSYQVAGTVGIMMCAVLGVRDRKAMPFAIDLGIAMQLTNICRDILEDAHLDRRYLPVDVPRETLLAASPEVHQPVIAAITAQLHNAEHFYASALQGLVYLPRGSRVAIYLAAILYRAIGRKLHAVNCAWWQGRVFLSTADKLRITLASVPAMIGLLLARTPREGLTHRKTLHRHLGSLPYVDC